MFNECIDLKNVTLKEYVFLGATLRLLYEPQYQCFSKEFKTDQQHDMHVLRNSCNSIIKNPKAFLRFDNMRYNTCFCNFYNPCINTLIQISEHIEKTGELPNRLTEKKLISSKMNKIHNIIQAYLSEIRAKELKRQQEEIRRNK